ncbi:Apolipoprotein N-acyltransferase [Minicystis rosea]|nr:Apolipoprotein N-acyltransferase [Minicystis rosea]
MESLRRHRALLLAVVGGVAFALTSPPTDLYPAVIIGLALLAASLGSGDGRAPLPPDRWPESPTFLRAFGRGAAWGTAAGLIGLRFVPAVIQRFTPLGAPVSFLALFLLAAAQSLIWAIGAGVTAVLHRRARVPFELAFGAGVLVSLCIPTIFAWSPAGLVSPWPAFVQLADVIGERGVSVLFAIGAALFARAAHIALSSNHRRALRPALAAIALFTVLPIHGALRMAAIARDGAALPTLRVGLVDHAVKPLDRWNHAHHPAIVRTLRGLTRTLEAQGAELVVWPEAAYPYPIAHDARTAPDGPNAIIGHGVRGPVIAGLITEDAPVVADDGTVVRSFYNSATLVSPDGSTQPPYDKLELLWFGETVPGSAYIPWLRRTFQRSGGLVPGDAPRALELSPPPAGGPHVRMAVLNCYEDTLPGLGRRLANALAPSLLVNVTNDAWFYATAEPELHARLGAMRAVELRRDLVRAVNLGVTSWIDAAGVVRARYEEQKPGSLLVTPTIREGAPTLYARFGDVPLFVLLAAASIAFAVRARRAAPIAEAKS